MATYKDGPLEILSNVGFTHDLPPDSIVIKLDGGGVLTIDKRCGNATVNKEAPDGTWVTVNGRTVVGCAPSRKEQLRRNRVQRNIGGTTSRPHPKKATQKRGPGTRERRVVIRQRRGAPDRMQVLISDAMNR